VNLQLKLAKLERELAAALQENRRLEKQVEKRGCALALEKARAPTPAKPCQKCERMQVQHEKDQAEVTRLTDLCERLQQRLTNREAQNALLREARK
jgi:hypothetical protein